MSEVVLTQPNLLDVSRIGNHLVTGTTKYLSTLPHPIEAVEELVAVSAVTCSLLNSLHHNIARFPSLSLSSTSSFLLPLCHDILFNFRLLSERVSEARRLRVFEPNDVGLVRVPRAAWCLVCGNEARAAGLRSRLYVEKYRVRVLIETVCWVGLNRKETRNPSEENELAALRNMLPLVAERLIGVQRDYMPRLRKLAGLDAVGEEEVLIEEMKEIPIPAPAQPVPQTKESPKADMRNDERPRLRCSKSGVSLTSTCSSSSSVTVLNPPVMYETWLLRCNEPSKSVQKSRTICGIRFSTTYTHVQETYYVKPVLSSESETRALRLECQNTLTPAQHAAVFKNQILNLPDGAQWEIQKLIESREAACSNENSKKNWEIVGFMIRERRKISHTLTEKKGWWKKSTKKSPVEYVLILRGETVDCEKRVMPKKHGDAWNSTPSTPSPSALASAPNQQAPQPQINAEPQQQAAQVLQQRGVSAILRHVENRRVMSLAEAEKKMKEIERDLFVSDSVEKD